jgi:IS30 family transposase
LAVGKRGTKAAVLTLAERVSRKSLYALVENKSQDEINRALEELSERFPPEKTVFKSITSDNGSEFSDFEGIKKALNREEVYYAHAYCSRERGSNENGNKMLRRFIPKGSGLSGLTKEVLLKYENRINNYPRRLLKYKTANEVFQETA